MLCYVYRGLLSTEGVYSRDMGRGNSREGGGAQAPCQADGAAGAQGLGGRVALEEGGAQPEREEHLDETHGVSD